MRSAAQYVELAEMCLKLSLKVDAHYEPTRKTALAAEALVYATLAQAATQAEALAFAEDEARDRKRLS